MQNEVLLHVNAFFFFFLPVQLNPLDAVLHIQNIAEKNWNQAVHTERIFIAFSRGTSSDVSQTSFGRSTRG